MPRTDDFAAYAGNWRQVLAADALVGAGGVLLGLVVLVLSSVVIGACVAALGSLYLLAVIRRWRRWRRLRADAGL